MNLSGLRRDVEREREEERKRERERERENACVGALKLILVSVLLFLVRSVFLVQYKPVVLGEARSCQVGAISSFGFCFAPGKQQNMLIEKFFFSATIADYVVCHEHTHCSDFLGR